MVQVGQQQARRAEWLGLREGQRLVFAWPPRTADIPLPAVFGVWLSGLVTAVWFIAYGAQGVMILSNASPLLVGLWLVLVPLVWALILLAVRAWYHFDSGCAQVTLTTAGLRCGEGGRLIPWPDFIEFRANWREAPLASMLQNDKYWAIVTRQGVFYVPDGHPETKRLEVVLERIERGREAGVGLFDADLELPDGAISPARLAGSAALDRGLSPSGEVSEDA